MCCIKPQCDKEEMIKAGWDKRIPYIIWPQSVINILIREIQQRSVSTLTVEFDKGEMGYTLTSHEKDKH